MKDKEWDKIESDLRKTIMESNPNITKVHINIRPTKESDELEVDVYKKNKTIWQKILSYFKEPSK